MINEKDPLILNIFANEILIKKLKIYDSTEHKVNIDLKNQLDIGLNVIKFVTENPITPVSKLESVDGRLLGFNLKSYKFK